jgi:hypothetical protein
MQLKPSITGSRGSLTNDEGKSVVSFGYFALYLSDDGERWAVEFSEVSHDGPPIRFNEPMRLNTPGMYWTVYVTSVMLGSYPPHGITGTFATTKVLPETILGYPVKSVNMSATPPDPNHQCCSTAHIAASVKVEFPFIGGPFHNTKDFLDPKTEVCDKAITQTYRPCLEDREIEALTGKETHWYPPGPTRVTYRYLRKTLQHNGRNYEVFGYAPMDLKRFARKAAKLADAGLL